LTARAGWVFINRAVAENSKSNASLLLKRFLPRADELAARVSQRQTD
jgi:hypothetical protein